MSQIMLILYVSQAVLNATDKWSIWTLSIKSREFRLRIMRHNIYYWGDPGRGGGVVLGSKFRCAEVFYPLSFVFLLKETGGKVEGCRVLKGEVIGRRLLQYALRVEDWRFLWIVYKYSISTTQKRDSLSIQQHKPGNSVREKLMCVMRILRNTQTHCVEKWVPGCICRWCMYLPLRRNG